MVISRVDDDVQCDVVTVAVFVVDGAAIIIFDAHQFCR